MVESNNFLSTNISAVRFTILRVDFIARQASGKKALSLVKIDTAGHIDKCGRRSLDNQQDMDQFLIDEADMSGLAVC